MFLLRVPSRRTAHNVEMLRPNVRHGLEAVKRPFGILGKRESNLPGLVMRRGIQTHNYKELDEKVNMQKQLLFGHPAPETESQYGKNLLNKVRENGEERWQKARAEIEELLGTSSLLNKVNFVYLFREGRNRYHRDTFFTTDFKETAKLRLNNMFKQILIHSPEKYHKEVIVAHKHLRFAPPNNGLYEILMRKSILKENMGQSIKVQAFIMTDLFITERQTTYPMYMALLLSHSGNSKYLPAFQCIWNYMEKKHGFDPAHAWKLDCALFSSEDIAAIEATCREIKPDFVLDETYATTPEAIEKRSLSVAEELVGKDYISDMRKCIAEERSSAKPSDLPVISIAPQLSSNLFFKELNIALDQLNDNTSDIEKQWLLECRSEQIAVEVSKNQEESLRKMGRGSSANVSRLYYEEWKKNISRAMDKDRALSLSTIIQKGKDAVLFSSAIPKEEFIDVCLRTTLDILLNQKGKDMPYYSIMTSVGEAVRDRYINKCIISYLKKSSERGFREKLKWYNELLKVNEVGHLKVMKLRQFWESIRDEVSSVHPDVPDWPQVVCAMVGNLFLEYACKECYIEKRGQSGKLYAFERSRSDFELDFEKRYSMIKLSEEFENSFKAGYSQSMVKLLPMTIPPVPWTSYIDGGYLTFKRHIMRTKNSHIQKELLKASSAGKEEMGMIYDGLNSISLTSWRINTFVLENLIECWNNGGNERVGVVEYQMLDEEEKRAMDLERKAILEKKKTKLRMLYADRKYVAEKISNYGTLSASENMEASGSLEELEKRKKLVGDEISAITTAINEIDDVLKKERDAHSQSISLLLNLIIARGFVGRPMYFPHDMDFRGRAYPVSPHLNHLGMDCQRALFLFDKGVPLGKTGLRWLQIHVANMYGVDKVSLDERVNFVSENEEKIRRCVVNPLEQNNEFWKKADSPWQFLAAAEEYVRALDSENIEEFVSRIPIQQDGSCNGLQHYAALGRDIEGGRGVNLVPADKPQDVYKMVADEVEKLLLIDIEEGDAVSKKLALSLTGKIGRKVVKRTVMTKVYGVTFIGAILQIDDEIGDWFEDKSYARQSSVYLTKKTFQALDNMFSGAKRIQQWFDVCAGSIASTGQFVSWKTPLGLPIVQPYAKKSMRRIRPGSATRVSCSEYSHTVDKRRQVNAFAPNYIHSLDSTHMLMTARVCKDEGLMFASVHDSFWTHASNVDRMSTILRDQFYELHKQPLLDELRAHFVKLAQNGSNKKNLQNIEIPPVPERGELELEEVKKSKYFFA
eukprot:Nk52_evm48s1671 gene=Nk52_evmTU48s1671